MEKRNGDTIRTDFNTVIIRIVDIAQFSADLIRMISDGTFDCTSVITLICGNDKGITTSECIEFIILPAFHKLVVPDSFLLTSFDGSLKELIKLGFGVVIAVPKRLTILGVVTTVEALLRTVVDDGNTSGEKGKDESVAILPGIRLDRKETRLIVVIDESAEDAGILEVLLILYQAVAKIAHGLTAGKDITHSEIHGIAKNAIEASLVARNIGDITVVVLTDGEFADGRLKFLPEGLLDLSDGVDTKTISVIGGKFLDVLDELLTDESVCLVQIREARETAVLDLGLVAPVLNVAA